MTEVKELEKQLADELKAERSYDPIKHPAYLVFEYYADIMMRKEQVEKLDAFLSGGVTNPVMDFSCYTIQAYKPVTNAHYKYNGSSVLDLVEPVDPDYARLPWAYKEQSWAATLLLAPFFGAYFVSLGLFLIIYRLESFMLV